VQELQNQNQSQSNAAWMTMQTGSSEGEAAKQARLEYDKLQEEIERRRLNIEDQQVKLQRQAEELQRQIDLVA
jgi:hypothetical protein